MIPSRKEKCKAVNKPSLIPRFPSSSQTNIQKHSLKFHHLKKASLIPKKPFKHKSLHRKARPSRIPILASRIKKPALPKQQRLIDAFNKLHISTNKKNITMETVIQDLNQMHV